MCGYRSRIQSLVLYNKLSLCTDNFVIIIIITTTIITVVIAKDTCRPTCKALDVLYPVVEV